MTLQIPAFANDSSSWPWLKAEKQVNQGDAVVQYLGTGGVLIEYAGEAILADPFFSNPSLSDLLFLRDLKPKSDIIKKYLPNTDSVKGLIVGHAHFDHLMDVPIVAGLLLESVSIYGSDTALNQIASAVSENRLMSITPLVKQGDVKTPWVKVSSRIRMMPLLAEHAPHIGGYLLAGGIVSQPLKHVPNDALDWQCGETLGYLLEWLDGDTVAFRVLYLSSSSGYPKGVPPEYYLQQLVDTNARIDVALLSTANFQAVENYPQGVLADIQPKAVVMLHWERFWQPYEPGQEKAIKEGEVTAFVQAIKESVPDAVSYLPRRLDVIPFPVEVEQ